MKKSTLLILISFSTITLFSQSFKSKEDRLAWWQDARFGMFIHWGPVSLTGYEIGWSRGSQTPINVYDSLYAKFNPVQFNADEWVAVAKSAGMKYIVLTSKHHDGFCLWDTKQTDYNIMNTPFNRDVVKELSAACKKQGMAFGLYYSTCDWHHPDFPLTSPGGKIRRSTSNLDAYTTYLKRQIAELLLNYGPLATIWFDVPQEFDAQRGQSVIDFAHVFQPDLIVNNRTGAKGDYSTPEQRIGEMQMDRPWETCMTIGQQWSYKPNEKLKSLQKCLQGLILSAAGNGNFLFNVGPSPLGVIEPEQTDLLKKMGAWLQKNGESIYGTQGGPYIKGRSIAATRKGNDVYIHLFDPTRNTIQLPALQATVLGASLLSGEKVDVRISGGSMILKLPPQKRDSISTIIKLHVDVPAKTLALIDPKDDILAKASSMQGKFSAEMVVDKIKSEYSKWTTPDSVRQGWIELDLQRPRSFDQLIINESANSHITKFSIEYKKGTEWVKIGKGETIGVEKRIHLKHVNAQFVRLKILESITAPSLLELDIHEID